MAAVPSCPSEAEDDDSELTSVTELQISDNEMSADGDVTAADQDAEQRQEGIRSEVKPTLVMSFKSATVVSVDSQLSRTSTLLHLAVFRRFFFCVFSSSISQCFSTYIPLMRLFQTAHHTKRRPGGILREGWLLHHTTIDTLVRHTR